MKVKKRKTHCLTTTWNVKEHMIPKLGLVPKWIQWKRHSAVGTQLFCAANGCLHFLNGFFYFIKFSFGSSFYVSLNAFGCQFGKFVAPSDSLLRLFSLIFAKKKMKNSKNSFHLKTVQMSNYFEKNERRITVCAFDVIGIINNVSSIFIEILFLNC